MCGRVRGEGEAGTEGMVKHATIGCDVLNMP